MFWFKKEKEYLNTIEELQCEIEKLNNKKCNLLFEICKLGCENEMLKIQNKRIEEFITDVEEALKKLKGEK